MFGKPNPHYDHTQYRLGVSRLLIQLRQSEIEGALQTHGLNRHVRRDIVELLSDLSAEILGCWPGESVVRLNGERLTITFEGWPRVEFVAFENDVKLVILPEARA
ncbi:hypothetical protein [Brevundimonas sp. EYE_349]|uniref:hypothetical protein n=1 Tax=Brevundimonas sp. EYE_349 TaxID=2853455 RepID=UPI0020048D98|nr:hypothetical protein [Brevundimonas sp. EYE_349]MCK6103348.1 hypothetical protein [Brevundimonas sp. EYE_349]